ncbi:MAG: hypothetical protein KF833_03035 [Verrucomicrobiae bacterium]|nr:hypothetical protein [Verrucomicrobiae bacterium]
MKSIIENGVRGGVLGGMMASVGVAAGIINFGFESGDFSGWDVDPGTGWAYVAQPTFYTHMSMAPVLYRYGGYEGRAMAVLHPGTDGVEATLSQTFELSGGSRVRGMAGFCLQPWYPPEAGAYVWMDAPDGTRTVLWEAVAEWGGVYWEQFDEIDRYWQGKGWDGWTYDAEVTGIYTLTFGCHGVGEYPVAGVFDGASVGTSPVPEGLGTLGAGLAAFGVLAGWRRAQAFHGRGDG